MYHVDRRRVALHIYGLLNSLRKTSKLLQVSHSTISRWLRQPERKPYPTRKSKTTLVAECIRASISNNPFKKHRTCVSNKGENDGYCGSQRQEHGGEGLAMVWFHQSNKRQVRGPRPQRGNQHPAVFAFAKAPGWATEKRGAAGIEQDHTEVDYALKGKNRTGRRAASGGVDSSNQARPWGGVTVSGGCSNETVLKWAK